MAKHRDPEANTTVLEREIDRHVYTLYGLTKDDITLIEDRPMSPRNIIPAIKKT